MGFFDLILPLVVLAVIGLPVAALVVLVRANNSIRELRAETASLYGWVRDLESKVQRLAAERAVASQSPTQPAPQSTEPQAHAQAESVAAETHAPEQPTPAAASQSPASATPSPAAQGIRAPRPMPAEPATETTTAARFFSLEETFGANWLNKLGIAILVIGLAFFLAYKLQTMGPGGKVLCGYSVSLVLLGGGVWLEHKATYRVFARAGIGGGWALGFFTTFAMYHVAAARVLSSVAVDLVLMLLVAAGMVAHSLRYRSQTVTGLGFLLGFATLLTSHMEAASGTVVFSLTASAVLALALVVVTTLRHWTVLELAGLAAVYLTHLVWLAQVLPADRAAFTQFWPSTALILLYWLVFRLAYVLRTPRDQKEEDLCSLAAVLNSGGVLTLLKYQSAHPEWAFWALTALGAAEMALAFWVRPRRRQAFVVLSTIATVLLVAAVPFRFHGVSWPVLWLVEAQALAVCGLRLGEPVFRRLGLLAGLATGAVLAVHDVLPLALFRLDHADPGRHAWLTVALALAAILYWVHAEVYTRRWPQIAEDELEALALRITSWLGAGAAATALWVAVPTPWVMVSWLALVLLLGLAADWIRSVSLALQADALAIMAIVGFNFSNDWFTGRWNHQVPLIAVVVLLYAGMRRKTVPAGSPGYVAAAYSWAASVWLVVLAAELSSNLFLTAIWAALGLALFEIGRFVRKGFLRWQGFSLVGLAFLSFLHFNFPDEFRDLPFGARPGSYANHLSLTHSMFLETLALAAAGYWLLDRSRDLERCSRTERTLGLLADALGTLSIALWFAWRFPSYWVPVPGGEVWVTAIWAAMATALLALAWWMRRRAFLVQALALTVAVALRGLFFDLSANRPSGFWHGPVFHLGVAALILLAALPFAFRLRGPELWLGASLLLPEPAQGALRRPEQWFFFAPFAMMVAALAVKLSSGHITIAWSLMGVGVFLFALVVGERSYRLAGLGLLLVSVVKILLMDVWALSPPDRYTTLIVLGLALLAVSFVYTRFSAMIRRYL